MPKKLFDDVFFFMSKTLPVDQSKQLSKVLSMNGGLSVSLKDGRLTHYITNSYPGEDTLEDIPANSNAHTVTTQWVERSLVLSSVQDPASYSPDPVMLFSGIIATAADLSQSDNEVLCAGISSLGGQWRTAYTKDVTHLFTLSDGSAKYATAMHFRETTGVRILVPHWFDDVVRLGMRNLPTDEYEWPNPKVFVNSGVEAIKKLTGEDGEELKEIKKPKPLSPHKRVLYETALANSSDLPAHRPASSNIWNGRKILLSFSLGLKKGQYDAHVADIERSGGKVIRQEQEEEEVEKVEEADILITKYRSGPAYAKAYRLRKTIGTLPWLWYVRATGVLSRPTDQFLHYPIPRRPVENFSKHIVSITNYTGKDREYVKKLILAMGAEFTPTLNTLVSDSGTKMTKARSWNIPVVNHTWLEDCFVQWRDLSPANSKYLAFPNSVDFGRVLGEKGLGHVGYTEDELAVLEQEIAIDDVDAGLRPPLASQPVDESPRRRRRNSTPGKGRKGNQDVDMTADISAGGYLDIDVPLDDDGRLSDIDIAPERDEVPERDDNTMDVDDSPSRRKSTRVAKTAAIPKSILKGLDEKAVPTPPSENAVADKAPQASTSGSRLVRRFGRESNPTLANKKGADETPTPKSPSQGRGNVDDSSKARTTRVDANLQEEVLASSSKLLVKRTYGAKSRSRSRSRARNEGAESDAQEPQSTWKATARARSRSRSRSNARDIESEDEDVRQSAKAPRERSTSRGRGRPRKGVSAHEKPASPAQEIRGRGRPPTRGKKPGDNVTSSKSPTKTTGMMTRSRSRSRAREVEEAGSEHEVAGRKGNQKATRKAIQDDSSDEVEEVTKPKTPLKKPSSAKAASKRKKPAVPTDTESEQGPPPKRSTKRRESIASAVATDDEAGAARTGRTPRQEVSVVLPTMKEVRSQSQGRGEDRRASDAAQRAERRRASPAASPSPSPPPKRGRGRPPKTASKAQEKLQPPAKANTPPPSKPARRRAMEPPAPEPAEAGPSTVDVPDTPASSVRSPSKRSAATKATKRLHDEIMPDVINFQKELKSGHVKSRADREEKGKDKDTAVVEMTRNGKGKKRASGDSDTLEAEGAPDKKKQKTAARKGPWQGKLYLCFVALNPHNVLRSPKKRREGEVIVLTTQFTFSDDIQKLFMKIGGRFTMKPSECTHLVAKNFVRTEKFLCGLAIAKYVVSARWVEMSALKQQWLSESDYPLEDAAAEAKYGIKIEEVIRRAKANKGKLFDGVTFYVTPKVVVEIKLLKNVVAAGGGQIVAQSPTLRILKGHEKRYVISHPDAVSIWRPLAEHGYPIYTPELILIAALKQKIDWENDSYKVAGSY
ncbi:hypothetical protein EIP86_009439 [Pleurotus ostreatoroseus]|nr:hypothetical protein EIP86_009439 [Pleurotus ostreatoroseus]